MNSNSFAGIKDTEDTDDDNDGIPDDEDIDDDNDGIPDDKEGQISDDLDGDGEFARSQN